MTDRVLPHDLDAERSVLGAVLVDPKAIDVAGSVLKPEHFYRKAHELIFVSLLALSERSVTADHVTLKDELVRRGQLNEVGGITYVAGLDAGLPRATNVESYARIVKEKAMLRELIYAANGVVQSAYDSAGDPHEVLGSAEQVFIRLSTESAPGDLVSADVVARELYPVLETLAQQRRPVTGISSGLYPLDRMTRGFQNGDLIIIAGRPSQGKTSIALQFALHAAATAPVAFFSLEMSQQALGMRAVSLLARVDAHEMQCGGLSDEEQGRVGRALQTLADLKWAVDDTPDVTPFQIRSKARRMKARHGLGMLVVDYMQLMAGGGRFENRTQEVSAISRAMKGVARDLNVPTLVLSQLSRKSEERADKRPQLSDLRESGAIEQDADLVCMVHRPPAPDGYQTATEFIVAKQRNGPIGMIELAFVKEQMRFTEVEHR